MNKTQVNLDIPLELWRPLSAVVQAEDWEQLKHLWNRHADSLSHLVAIVGCEAKVNWTAQLPTPRQWGKRGALVFFVPADYPLVLCSEAIDLAKCGKDFGYLFDYTVMLDTNVVSHLESWGRGVLEGDLRLSVAECIEYIINGGYNFDWVPYTLENCEALDHPKVLDKLSAVEQMRGPHRAKQTVQLRECPRLPEFVPPQLARDRAKQSLGEYRKMRDYFDSQLRQKELAHIHLLYAAIAMRHAGEGALPTATFVSMVEQMDRDFPLFGSVEQSVCARFIEQAHRNPFFAPLLRRPAADDGWNEALRAIKAMAWDMTHFRNLYRFSSATVMSQQKLTFTYLASFDPKFWALADILRPKAVIFNRRRQAYEAILPAPQLGFGDDRLECRWQSLFEPRAIARRKGRAPAYASLDALRTKRASLEQEFCSGMSTAD